MPSPSQTPASEAVAPVRHDWTAREARALHDLPLPELLFRAQSVHRQHFRPDEIQLSTLLSIKTGGCPEDCAYCPQSAHWESGRRVEPLLPVEQVLAAARRAREAGATRFCMGAAWRSPRERDLERVREMVAGVKALGLETCVTLGMLDAGQARSLRDAGLDYYNHNLDTSPEFYGEIVSTRSYTDRLDTLGHVRDAGLKVCCGGIVGMGEGVDHRIGLLLALAGLPEHPQSVPVNLLVKVEGTPLDRVEPPDGIEFVRIVALARLLMPRAHVRLSAGRESMSDELHALCFLAGANSIFYGEMLLTTANASLDRDRSLFRRLGLSPEQGGPSWSALGAASAGDA